MTLTFLGAARTVTGSSYLLEHEGYTLLIDAGMPQGSDKESIGLSLAFKPKDIDAVILTHAHMDHAGRLPLMYKEGYRGRIYATDATKMLSRVMLLDSARIQESDAETRNIELLRLGEEKEEPLYTEDDAIKAISLFRSTPYKKRIKLNDSISFELVDVGHLLGSSSVIVYIKLKSGEERKIVFSGDIGNKNLPMLRDPEYIKSADFVVMESTYGDRNQVSFNETIRDRAERLAEIIDRTFKRGGNLIIPSFAVGRSQEILYLLRLISDKKILDYEIPVYLDSPLSAKATRVYGECIRGDYFDEEAMKMIREGINPILFKSLKVISKSEDSRKLNYIDHGIVIISTSGMCEAGRIRHHLKHNLWRKECTILFVGYQGEGTLGREILDGAERVDIFGDDVSVRAEICRLEGLSGHADQKGLINWIRAFNPAPRHVFVTHGEMNVAEYFASLLNKEYKIAAYAPRLHETFDLINDELPLQDDTSLKNKTSIDLANALSSLEYSKSELSELIKKIKDRSEEIDFQNEDEALKLLSSTRRLTQDIESIRRKWKKDLKAKN